LDNFTLTTLKKRAAAGILFFLVTFAVHARGGNDPSVTVTTPAPDSRLVSINWMQVKNPQQTSYTLYRANRVDHSFTAVKAVSMMDHQVLDENLPPPLSNYFYFITHEGFEKLNQGVKITDAEIAAQLATIPAEYGAYPYDGYSQQTGARNADALNNNVRPVNEGISLGLIIFNNKVVTESSLLPLDPAGRQELMERLNAAYIHSGANGTALYYAEHTALAALNRLDAAKILPSNLQSVNIITFTVGLDTSSTDVSLPPPDTNSFAGKQSAAYRAFINQQIKTKRIGNRRIDAWAIGVPGRDTVNSGEFQSTLGAISSSPENLFYINDASEVERSLLGIADTIKISAQRASLMFTTPAYSVGTTVRITFDKAYHPANSNQFIEGRIAYSDNNYTLTNLQAQGLPLATKGPITGRRGDAGIEYTIAVDDDFSENSIMQWYKLNSLAGDDWQQNSEFTTLKLNDYTSGRKSAAIYLVLDCSSTINEAGIATVRAAAMRFIDKLYNAGGGYELGSAPALVLSQSNQNVIPRTGPSPQTRNPVITQSVPPSHHYPQPPSAVQWAQTQTPPPQAAQYTQIQVNPSAASQYTYIQTVPSATAQPPVVVQPAPSAAAQWMQIQTVPQTLPAERKAPPLPVRNAAPAYLGSYLPPASADWSAPYSGFWVQVGSYTEISFAQDCWRKLYHAGCASTEIFSKDVDGLTRYRVKVGPYQNRQTAEAARDILRAFDADYRGSYVVEQ
jgi:cell division protein FtsN